MARRPEERIDVLGGVVDLMKPQEIFHFVRERIALGGKAVIANHNLHSLYLIQRQPEVRQFFECADVVQADSVPLLFWARLVGRPSRRFHRSTYLDWRHDFWCAVSQEGWRVFFLGGGAETCAMAAAKIGAQWPRVRLATHHGYFDADPASAANLEVLASIRAFEPDILLVGMGMPRQEFWIWDNYDQLPECVMFTVGGAFDYEAGAQKPCPRWLGQLGLEWMFRLAQDPERLFFRYCIEPAHLVWPALQDLARAVRGEPHGPAPQPLPGDRGHGGEPEPDMARRR